MSEQRPRLDQLTPAQQAELMRKLAGAGQRAKPPPLTATSRGEHPPLSYAQQRMWFLQQLDPDSVAYSIVLAHRLRGPLDIAALQRAFDELVRRHESLRTVFPAIRGEPYQRVLPPASAPISIETAPDLDAAVRDEELRPFDLATGPLFRTRLLRAGEHDHVLVIAMHHIISDGWSMGVFWRELATLYAGRAPLPPLAVQYADYAAWQRGWLVGATLERQLEYWKERLRGAPDQIELPFKGPRPPVQTFAGDKVVIAIDAELAARLRALARHEGTTLFITLLAAFRALLARYTGQDDLSIGTPIANRSRTEIEGAIGLFANTLVLRNEVRADDSFASLLSREKAIALAAYDHMETPFEAVVDAVGVERSMDRTPLFQVMYAHEPADDGGVELAGLATEVIDTTSRTAKLDLSVTSSEHGDRLGVRLIYNVDLFDRATIEQLARHFITLLEHVAGAPGQRLARIELLERAERERLLVEWNATARPLDGKASALALVEAQVDRTPDAIAVVCGDARVTYRELDERANQLAGHLAGLGAGADQVIAVLVERSSDLVVALLAVWKTGAAYLPLDPHHPRDRLAYIIEDSGARLVVTERALLAAVPADRTAVVLDRDRAAIERRPATRPGLAGALAYVIYTSGSTGRPKGVAVAHRSLRNFLGAMRRTLEIGAHDTLLAVTTVAFDISGLELWLPLCAGARVLLASADEAMDPRELARQIDSTTILQATPATWRMLVDAGWPGRHELVALCGGEALPADLSRALGSRVRRLWNLYGPTETTIWSAARVVGPDESPVRVGGPIDNTQLYVVDRALMPVPLGVAGELCIAGEGLARGYHGRPDLTAERFVPDPFGPPGRRMYRTGDLVRRRADGTLAFLGRLDHQVKLRGFRIELGEIEDTLAGHPAVRQAVVVVRDGQLVGYLVLGDGGDAALIRAHLAETLPDYMIPAALVTLEALPLSPSGKIDRKALPAPSDAAYVRSVYVAPRTEAEEVIAGIWRELLGVERIGAHDDFFALGGNSLRVIRLVAEIERACGVRIPVRKVFDRPTIEAIAAYVASSTRDTSTRIGYVRTGATHARATVPQEYFWYLDRDDHDPESYFITNVLSIEGPLDAALLARSYAELVAYHGIYRTAYHEVDGVLQQIVLPLERAQPAPLDIVDRSAVPRDAWDGELQRTVAELAARGYDLAAARGLIHARLIRRTERDHALVVLGHHIVMDGGSAAALRKQLFEGYARLRGGAASALPAEPPLQYIDFARARDERAATPAGTQQDERWTTLLRDAPAVVLDGDLPRAPIDARRDAAPLGITADLSHPPETVRLPDATYAAVASAARAARTTPFVVFLSALAWLVRERSGQTDITLQATYTPRAQDPVLDPIHGTLTTWTVFRIDLGDSATLGDAIQRTAPAVEAVHDTGTPYDFYRRVPHGLRRVVFNYLPVRAAPGGVAYADVTVKVVPWRFPPWKRPWDLHLTLVDDATSARLVWTGFQQLFRRETVVALLDRYIAILGHA